MARTMGRRVAATHLAIAATGEAANRRRQPVWPGSRIRNWPRRHSHHSTTCRQTSAADGARSSARQRRVTSSPRGRCSAPWHAGAGSTGRRPLSIPTTARLAASAPPATSENATSRRWRQIGIRRADCAAAARPAPPAGARGARLVGGDHLGPRARLAGATVRRRTHRPPLDALLDRLRVGLLWRLLVDAVSAREARRPLARAVLVDLAVRPVGIGRERRLGSRVRTAPRRHGARLRVCAPGASIVQAVLTPGPTGAHDARGRRTFEACGRRAAGDRYRLQRDDHPSWPDPCSRWQPEGVHGPSSSSTPAASRGPTRLARRAPPSGW